MKRTWFYSEQQAEVIRIFHSNRINFIKGKQFTEQMGGEGEHKSNWPDAVIVHEEFNLPVDEFTIEHTGKKYAISVY